MLPKNREGVSTAFHLLGASLGIYWVFGIGGGLGTRDAGLFLFGVFCACLSGFVMVCLWVKSLMQCRFDKNITSTELCSGIIFSLMHCIFSNLCAYVLGILTIPLFGCKLFFEILLSAAVFICAVVSTSIILPFTPLFVALNFRNPLWVSLKKFWGQFGICSQGFYATCFHVVGLNIHSQFSLMYFLKLLFAGIYMVLITYALVLLAPACFFLTFVEKVKTKHQLEGWYRELEKNKFDRKLLLKLSFKSFEQRSECPKIIAAGGLGLTLENFEPLLQTGLRFEIVPSGPIKANLFFRLVFTLSVVFASGGLRYYVYHRSAFVSHRWGDSKTCTWYGHKGWQFREVLKYLEKHSAVQYVWIDGLCAPQDGEKMVVIDHLAEIVNGCHFFICIDGSGVELDIDDQPKLQRDTPKENKYMSRVWCLYELFLGGRAGKYNEKSLQKTLVPIFPDDLNISEFLKNKEKDIVVSSLFNGSVQVDEDKNRILLNVLGISDVYQKMGSILEMGGLFQNLRIHFLTSYNCAYQYFPFELAIALHFVFLKLQSYLSKETLDKLTLAGQSKAPRKIKLVKVQPSPEHKVCCLLSDEIKYYAQVHWHQHYLGFRTYFAKELFTLDFSLLKKFQVLERHDLESVVIDEGSKQICARFQLTFFGQDTCAILKCFPDNKTCTVVFEERAKSWAPASSGWKDYEWIETTKEQVVKTKVWAENNSWVHYKII